jgi:cellulose biosynthesis protein BcsQ
LNVAIGLSQKKQKVLFVEINDQTPAVNYWYEMGHIEYGIDDALKGMQLRDFERIEKSIIRSSDLQNLATPMQKNYKKFPNKLDFLFYSTQYLTRKPIDRIDLDLSLTKDLYLHLLYQMEYDYIILDVSSDLTNVAVFNALAYSHKLFLTVTQDVSTVGNAVYFINELNKQGIQITKKLNLIINKFEQAEIGEKEICEWMQIENVLTVPCMNKEFINANFVGLPVALATKVSQLKNAFNSIEKIIL